jgi:hypothetical protein
MTSWCFEHLTPGNGIYMLFADWAEQSKRTKSDLLAHAEEGRDYIRITHTIYLNQHAIDAGG